MAGYNQQAMSNKVRNANCVSIIVGDQLIGFGQSQTYSIDAGAESLYGIGSAKPQENQQLKFGINVTLESFELTEVGVAFFGAGSTWIDVLFGNELTFHSVDAAGNTIMTVVGCVAQNFSRSVPVNQPITQATTFIAMDVLNADGDSVLQDSPGSTLDAIGSLVSNAAAGVI